MDHIKPLIEAQGDLSFWQMGNLQTLCHPCHTAKTSSEATERAAKRRAAKATPPIDPNPLI
jgi:5-methylcytosine-specific restriction endonuclease McrA